MNLLGICLCLLAPQKDEAPTQAPTLGFYQDSFIARVGAKRAAVPLQLPKERPPLSVSYRRNNSFAVWDDRGLTIRIGKKAKSLRLEEFAVSPKIFSREEILQTLQDIKAKKRKRGAAALSGARRIGLVGYFLVRWEDSDGKTWLETLVSVNLAEPSFHPTLLARLPGTSLATKPIDDQLILLGNRISSVIRKGNTWGLATFDADQDRFEYNPMGRHLVGYTALTNRLGAFVERTDYGSNVGGRVDLAVLTRNELVESKGTLRFADGLQPMVAVIGKKDGVALRNVETGAELKLPASIALRRTPLGIVAWSPYTSPKRAWLLEPTRWSELAQWTAKQPD